MNGRKRILGLCAVAVLFVCMDMPVFAEGQQRLSFCADFIGSGPLFSANIEYAPSAHWDVGTGVTMSIFPVAEVHLLARYNFMDYFVSPYVQLSASFLYPGQIDNNENWFNSKVIAGAKFKFGKLFFCGIGGGYNFIGQNLAPLLSYNGFFPTAFAGITFLRW